MLGLHGAEHCFFKRSQRRFDPRRRADLRRDCLDGLEAIARYTDDDRLVDFLVYRPEPKTRPWSLFRTERGFRVVGTPPGEEELERALRAAGAKRGAAVEIGEETLELA